jgi:hypothetical protein
MVDRKKLTEYKISWMNFTFRRQCEKLPRFVKVAKIIPRSIIVERITQEGYFAATGILNT